MWKTTIRQCLLFNPFELKPDLNFFCVFKQAKHKKVTKYRNTNSKKKLSKGK